VTCTFIGALSIGDAAPGVSVAFAAALTGINAALPDLAARIAALGDFAPQPVDFSAQLSLAQLVVQNVELCISAGIPVPSIAAQIAAVEALVAQLAAQLALAEAQVDIVTAAQARLSAGAGVFAYAFSGTAGALGAELDAARAIGGPAGNPPINGLVLLTADPVTWAAMTALFKVTP
jgi:hypothetical protein